MEAASDVSYYEFRRVDATRSPVCGLAMLNPGWTHMRRRLDTETVLLIGKRGGAVIADDGVPLEISEGRMLLLPAGHLHCGREPAKKPLSYWWFHFYQCVELDEEIRFFLPRRLNAADARRALSAPEENPALFKSSIVLPQVMTLSKPDLVGNLCGEALRAFSCAGESPLLYYNAVQRLLLELSVQSRSQVQNSVADESAPRALVKQVLELLESELSNPNASVKYFADSLGVNADYLGRCFKDVERLPVGQYISHRRVELACTRLRESNRTVEEIATECGFGSRRQFYDEFRRRTGKTPSAYRAESAYVGVTGL